MVRAAVLVAVCVLGTGAGAVAQTAPVPPRPMQPPRDPSRQPPDPPGTAIIRGRVIAADTGTPIRRANVNLSPTAPPVQPGSNAAPPLAATPPPVGIGASVSIQGPQQMRPRSVVTDAQGAFEFKNLPAGYYRLSAMPGQYSAAYLGINFGAKRPNGPGMVDAGTPIQVADGQTADRVTVALPRGAVIVGRVSDENGEPMARVQVSTILYPAASARGMRSGPGAQSDDLGQFRLFGLVPGDYAIVAEARGNMYVPPNAPPETDEERIGFMQTFYPGTADEAGAQRVSAKAGSETQNVDIRMVSGRMFHITGIVTDSQGRTSTRASGTLFKRGPGMALISTFGFSTDEQGRFQLRNIPPGNYRMSVRQQPQGPRGADGSQDPGEFATLPLAIAADLDNILITTAPGATITGAIVLENGLPQQGAPPQLRVSANFADTDNMIGVPMPQPAMVSPDYTFTMKGLTGELLVRSGGANLFLKSVLLGAEDIVDTPHEFKTGERITVVLTSRAGTIEGNVLDGAGKPAPDSSILIFSDEKALWRVNSIRTRRSSVDSAGHYRLMGLLPGRYYLLALPRERAAALSLATDASAFEALSKEATTVVIGEDEQRQVELHLSGVGGY